MLRFFERSGIVSTRIDLRHEDEGGIERKRQI